MKVQSTKIIDQALDEYMMPWAWCMECANDIHTAPECLTHFLFEDDYEDECDCEECLTPVLSQEYRFDMWCAYTTKWGEVFDLEAA